MSISYKIYGGKQQHKATIVNAYKVCRVSDAFTGFFNFYNDCESMTEFYVYDILGKMYNILCFYVYMYIIIYIYHIHISYTYVGKT